MSDKKPAVDQHVILDEVNIPVTRVDQEKDRAAKKLSGVKTDQMVIQAKVYSPFKDYFDGPAFSLSAENETGPFDVLPRHHNFISLLSPCEIVIRTAQGEKMTILISGGLLHAKADRVVVFLDV